VFLLGTLIAVIFLHRRSSLTLVTGRRYIDWRRVGTGLGVWFALAVLASLVGCGAFLAWVSLRDGTLEFAIGAHAANNLFGAAVLGFEGSALNTPTLFLTDRFVPAYSLIQFVAVAASFYVAVFALFKRRTKKGR
jgi:hypothetical protein